jgi:hypothetical protein
VKKLVAVIAASALFVCGALTAFADDGTPGTTTTVATTTVAATTTDGTTTAAVPTTTPETTTTVATTTTAPATTTTTPTAPSLPWWWWLVHPKTKTPSPKPSPGTTAGTTTASAPVSPAPPAHLTVAGAVTPPVGATVGSTVAYSFAITNTGGQAVGAAFTDALPAQVIPIAADADQGSCTSGQTVACSLGSIGAGVTVGVTIAVQVAQPGSLSDAAAVAAGSASVGVDQPLALALVAGPAGAPVTFAVAKSATRAKSSARK